MVEQGLLHETRFCAEAHVEETFLYIYIFLIWVPECSFQCTLFVVSILRVARDFVMSWNSKNSKLQARLVASTLTNCPFSSSFHQLDFHLSFLHLLGFV